MLGGNCRANEKLEVRCRTLRTECVGLGAGSLCLGVCGLQGGGEETGSLCFRGLRAPEGWISVSQGIVDGSWVSVPRSLCHLSEARLPAEGRRGTCLFSFQKFYWREKSKNDFGLYSKSRSSPRVKS